MTWPLIQDYLHDGFIQVGPLGFFEAGWKHAGFCFDVLLGETLLEM